MASTARIVAGADAHGIRVRQVEDLRVRLERQAAKGLDAYRHVIDANNNYERAALVFNALHEATVFLSDESAAVGFVRRNVPGLTAKLFSDRKVVDLLYTLARPGASDAAAIKRAKAWLPDARYLSFTKRVEACLKALSVLGLCPNSHANGNEIETLRKKIREAAGERRRDFGLEPRVGRETKRQKPIESRDSAVTGFPADLSQAARDGSPPYQDAIAAPTPNPAPWTGARRRAHRA